MSGTITIDGLTFSVETVINNDQAHPWEHEDGHGPVRAARADYYTGRVQKAPGERVLTAGRGYAWVYGWSEAVEIARRDGWGLSNERAARLSQSLGRAPTAGEVTAEAVRMDFERLRAWCEDRWYYVGVVVTLLDTDGKPVPGCQDSIWGIESDATDYIVETARELATSIAQAVEKSRRAPAEPCGDHTPEPWRVHHDQRQRDGLWELVGYNIEAEQGHEIVGCEGIEVWKDNAEANARRIVACVNACAGIPTETLEDASTVVMTERVPGSAA